MDVVRLIMAVAMVVMTTQADCDIDDDTGRLDCLLKIVRKMEAKQKKNVETMRKIEKRQNKKAEELEKNNAKMQEKIMALQQQVAIKSRSKRQLAGNDIGVTYIRWGRMTCPGNITTTQLVYFGSAGGSLWDETGGGSNYVCLSRTPEWNVYNDAVSDTAAYMHGAEYQLQSSTGFPFYTNNDLTHQDVPCAVCLAKRSAFLMIPGKMSCPTDWHKEYSGYLMAERYGFGHHRSEFICMDGEPVAQQGGGTNINGVLFYNVEARCGPLLCPPYYEGREITCVVCTK